MSSGSTYLPSSLRAEDASRRGPIPAMEALEQRLLLSGQTFQPVMWDIVDWSMAKTYVLQAEQNPTDGIANVDALTQTPGSVPGAQEIDKAHTHSGSALIGMTEDSWSVVKVVTILTDPGGDILWSQAADPVNEIVGLVYGGVDNFVAVDAIGQQVVVTEGIFYDVYMQPIGTWDDTLGSDGRVAFDKYVGAGYDYNDFGLDGVAGTPDFGEGNGKFDPGETVFPVGTLIVQAESAPGKTQFGASGPVHRISKFVPNPPPVGAGDGTGFEFIDIVGGTWQQPGVGYFDELPPFYYPNVDYRFGSSEHGDLHANQTVSPYDQPEGDWIISSADPVRGGWGLGLPEPAAIGDRVWHDLDADGIQDAGEPGIDGVTVNLYDGAGGPAGTTTTAGDGLYLFDGLTPGDYYVEFIPPAGMAISPQDQGADDAVDSDVDPNTNRTATTTLDAGETDLTWDAGYYQPTGGEGGTPGFWKAKNHASEWIPTGFDQSDSYEVVFGVDLDGKLDGISLIDAIKLGGGGMKAMMRHSVAAILNAGHPDVDYDLTVDEVIGLVQDAFAGYKTFEEVKGILAAFNEQPHPL